MADNINPEVTQLMNLVADGNRRNDERQAAYDRIEAICRKAKVSLEDAGVTASWRSTALQGLKQDPQGPDETAEDDPSKLIVDDSRLAARSRVEAPSREEMGLGAPESTTGAPEVDDGGAPIELAKDEPKTSKEVVKSETDRRTSGAAEGGA